MKSIAIGLVGRGQRKEGRVERRQLGAGDRRHPAHLVSHLSCPRQVRGCETRSPVARSMHTDNTCSATSLLSDCKCWVVLFLSRVNHKR